MTRSTALSRYELSSMTRSEALRRKRSICRRMTLASSSTTPRPRRGSSACAPIPKGLFAPRPKLRQQRLALSRRARQRSRKSRCRADAVRSCRRLPKKSPSQLERLRETYASHGGSGGKMDKKRDTKLRLVEPVEFTPVSKLEREARREFIVLVGIIVAMLVA